MNYCPFIYLFLTLMKFSYSKLSDQCLKSNTFWNSVKYPYVENFKQKSDQNFVNECQSLSSENCCNTDMFKEMTIVSELKLIEFAEDKIESILKMFSNDSYDLINIILKDLENTKNDLHQLFSTTYGYNYKMHKIFFFTWFDKLKLYMQGQLHNIGQLVDNFFNEMAEKIVQILMGPDSKLSTIKCHTARLIESKPFSDTDVLLRKKIMRSYPPARLLLNGIGVGRDVFNELMKNTSPSHKCLQESNTVFHCMLCRGLTIKPCSNSCQSVIDNCFGSFKSSDIKRMDRSFTKYIKSIVQLASKSDNPFNFPEVNSKMNVQISTAIMNIQTMYPNIKEQIQNRCQVEGGRSGTQVTRKRRQASQEFYKWQSNNGQQHRTSWEPSPTTNINEIGFNKKDFNYKSKSKDGLTPFVRNIKQKYKSLENYFQNQKQEVCSKISTTDASIDCWNGSAVTRSSVFQEVKKTKNKGDASESPVIKSALSQLNDITNRIQSYLSDTNTDPETLFVHPYKVYLSRKVNKPTESNSQVIFNQKIDGSGDTELNKFAQSNSKPKTSEETVDVQPVEPQQQKKSKSEFQTLVEGSGNVNNEIPSLSSKSLLVSNNSIISSTSPSRNIFVMSSATLSTIASNQIPDDEDLNPASKGNAPKIDKPVGSATQSFLVIEPEESMGSGNKPIVPSFVSNVPVPVVPNIVTESVLDGSGDGMKKNIEKPPYSFPMLPDSRQAVSSTPRQVSDKPIIYTDEEPAPVEGSGGKSDNRPPPTMLTRTPSLPPSTSPSSASVSPDNYPGKIPSEVWLPRIEGARNQDKDGRRSTPSGSASTICDRTFLRTMLILFSIGSLL